jgi:hypothetical protein
MHVRLQLYCFPFLLWACLHQFTELWLDLLQCRTSPDSDLASSNQRSPRSFLPARAFYFTCLPYTCAPVRWVYLTVSLLDRLLIQIVLGPSVRPAFPFCTLLLAIYFKGYVSPSEAILFADDNWWCSLSCFLILIAFHCKTSAVLYYDIPCLPW